MYYTYILENNKGWHYIGSCENLERRLRRHNQNSVRSAKNRGPFDLIYKKECDTRTKMRKFENKLKRCKGKGTFKILIESTLPSSSSLA